jgi:hypothetical protein
MNKKITNTLFFFVVTLILIVTGCGSSDSPTASTATNASQSKVFGVASLGTTTAITVTVKDSSVPTQEKTAALGSNGSYTAEVSRLKAPFILKASGIDETGGTIVLYSVSANGGHANINEISDLAVAVAASADTNATGREMSESWSNDNGDNRRTANNFDNVINSLRTVLAPLFALYNISGNPVTAEDGGEHDSENSNSGLSALLRDVRFTVKDAIVIVTNRATGGIIFSGSRRNLNSGTFYPENMPAGPGGSTACTSFTYSVWGTCQSDGTQTRTTATSSPAGCTGGTPVLSQSCTYVPLAPSPCTYNYSNWGACQSNGMQTRTVTSSPAGCSGTPAALSQSCTYVPPITTCTSFTYNTWGTCTNGTQTRTVATSTPASCTGGSPVLSQPCASPCTSFMYNAWGTCTNGTQTRTVSTSTPAGCTGGAPVLSQSCTSPCAYNYSNWGACQSNGTQTRTMTSSPAGCSGTPAALSQSCTYVPPVTTCTSFTYNTWGTCTNGTQTRTVATSTPAGCTGGTPVLSQACTSPTPACGSCHAIPPATGQHNWHVNTLGYQCSTCHGAGYSSTAVTAATHMNGVVNTLASLNYSANTCGSPGCHGSRSW